MKVVKIDLLGRMISTSRKGMTCLSPGHIEFHKHIQYFTKVERLPDPPLGQRIEKANRWQ